MEFEMTKRQGVVVWVYSLRQLKNLKRFGSLQYVSKKMKYAYIYMNQENLEMNLEKMNKLHFVRHVEVSHRPELDMDFGNRVGDTSRLESDDERSGDFELISTKDYSKNRH